jgi:hypothetical protein
LAQVVLDFSIKPHDSGLLFAGRFFITLQRRKADKNQKLYERNNFENWKQPVEWEKMEQP